MTLANKITFARLGLVLVYLVILYFAVEYQHRTILLDIASILFLICAFLDVLDGYLARLYHESTELGRVLDPLVDKITICCSLIFCLKLAPLTGILEPWMVVIIIIREFLIHGLRIDQETRGTAFGASFWGKQKTFIQSAAVVCCLVYSAHLYRMEFRTTGGYLLLALIWLMILSTISSGIIYIMMAGSEKQTIYTRQ